MMDDGRCPDAVWAGACKTLKDCSAALVDAAKAKKATKTAAKKKAVKASKKAAPKKAAKRAARIVTLDIHTHINVPEAAQMQRALVSEEETQKAARYAAATARDKGVINPAALHRQSGSYANVGSNTTPIYMDTYGPQSGVGLLAGTGDITLSIAPVAMNSSTSTTYPASFSALAEPR